MYVYIGSDDYYLDVPFYGSISNFELRYGYTNTQDVNLST